MCQNRNPKRKRGTAYEYDNQKKQIVFWWKMEYQIQCVIRTIVKGAMGLCSPEETLKTLDKHLFLDILPASDAGEIAKEAVDVLIDTYQQMTSNSGQCLDDTLFLTAKRLSTISGIPEKDPIGIVGFSLHEIVTTKRLTGQNAVTLVSLPWQTVADALSSHERLESFFQLLHCLAHEVDEGFISQETQDAELYEEAKYLLSKIILLF